MNRIIPVLWLWLACAIIGAAAGIKAHAEPAEPATTFAIAHAADICTALDTLPTITGLVNTMQAIADTGLGARDAAGATALAVLNVCPHHLPLLRKFVAQYGTKGVSA